MQAVRTFVVVPLLPESLQDLKKVAQNIWWGWDRDAVDLFQRLDLNLWKKCEHNPMKMLGKMSQDRLNEIAEDEGFLAHLDRVCKKMEAYINRPRWYDSIDTSQKPGMIAYFSAEFGLHESLPIYSGGLGILAGDHLKSASDLGLPLIGVGLLYRHGYFQQYLNNDGWQQEAYPENDFYNMSVTLVKQDDGSPTRFHVEIGDHEVVAQVWRIQVGRVPLFLMDTNLRCNRIEDRQITANLYGGDHEMRIRQEILLGIGGVTALRCLGITPTVCHMNEGHAAFLGLERIRRVMQEHQVNFAQAREATIPGQVFTTHTPVPAGHDVFSASVVEKYLGRYSRHFGLDWNAFLALGRTNAIDESEPFSMTNLAIHLSSFRNGVSKLHGEVSREMCQPVWPGVPVDEIPIDSITNGIHIRSWISHEMSEVFDRYLGPGWSDQTSNRAIYERTEHIPDEELWRTHERQRERLVMFSRQHLRDQLQHRGANPNEIALADEVLDPEALTIGFARRFATYKRGALLFHDLDRFKRIITDKERPVQIIFSGKAHPRDNAGKELIRQIVHFLRDEPFCRRIVFLENYNINVARNLVQGVDVWLNTPRRGMEASGTSGMKVLGNGGLNVSILDGWWCEGYDEGPDVGWAIGQGERYDDSAYENEVESHALYDLLEKEVIPAFYNRGTDRLPRKWIAKMKSSIRNLTPVFSTSRMVSEYAQKFYLPAGERWEAFQKNDLEKAKNLADWKESMNDRWHDVQIDKIDVLTKGELQVGRDLDVRCQVKLGQIFPAEVAVEIYQGLVDSEGRIQKGQSVEMECRKESVGDIYTYTGSIVCSRSGRCGFAICVLAKNKDLTCKFDTGLIRWEQRVSEPAKVPAAAELDDGDVIE